MTRSIGTIPRFIAVGIGYPGAPGFLQALAMRTRDLTPVVAALEGSSSANMPIEGMLKPATATGGGPRFLDFMRDELIPFIDSRYPTDPKDRAYWGDSLGGLFGCYVLVTRPDTFNRYIIGSPSAWWANEGAMKLAERYVTTHDDLAATVFLGVGGLEESPDNAQSRMVTNILRLEKLLRSKKFPSLQLTTHLFPDESHITVFDMNLVRGLVAVYGRPVPGDRLMDRYNAAILKRSNPSPAPKPEP
jgi:predicted alpha/beta superfamily hydrolase